MAASACRSSSAAVQRLPRLRRQAHADAGPDHGAAHAQGGVEGLGDPLGHRVRVEASVSSTANSSPPSRATVSCGRTQLRSLAATSTSSSSAAERPSTSLRCLKSSRFSSRMSTGSGRRRAAASRSLKRGPLGSAVRGSRSEPGLEFVVVLGKRRRSGGRWSLRKREAPAAPGVRRRSKVAAEGAAGAAGMGYSLRGSARAAPRIERATDVPASAAPAGAGTSEHVISTGSSVPSARRPEPANGGAGTWRPWPARPGRRGIPPARPRPGACCGPRRGVAPGGSRRAVPRPH